MRRATTVEPPGEEEERGERSRGLGKRVCASKSSQYLCNRIVSPYEESLLGKQGEKKIRRGERMRAVPKGRGEGGGREKRELPRGEVRGEEA